MTDFKQDALRIQKLTGAAYRSAGALTEAEDDPVKRQQSLERMMAQFEESTLALRTLCETHSHSGARPYSKPATPHLEIAGSIEFIEGHWLHIRLEALLPHCRYQTPMYISDTISRLLNGFEAGGQKLPFYRRALLVIDEHSRMGARNVYDQDNKGWKAISNALKGRLVPDDDQYSLGVALLSAWRPDNVCHITLLDIQESSNFFVLRSDPYSMDSMYQGF